MKNLTKLYCRALSPIIGRDVLTQEEYLKLRPKIEVVGGEFRAVEKQLNKLKKLENN